MGKTKKETIGKLGLHQNQVKAPFYQAGHFYSKRFLELFSFTQYLFTKTFIMRKKIVDKIDVHILNCLQLDAKISNIELSREIGLSAPATLVRVNNLFKRGIIKGIRAEINPGYFGYDYQYMIFVTVKEADVKSFLNRVKEIREITFCLEVSSNNLAKDLRRYILKLLSKSRINEQKVHGYLPENIDIFKLDIVMCRELLNGKRMILTADG